MNQNRTSPFSFMIISVIYELFYNDLSLLVRTVPTFKQIQRSGQASE